MHLFYRNEINLFSMLVGMDACLAQMIHMPSSILNGRCGEVALGELRQRKGNVKDVNYVRRCLLIVSDSCHQKVLLRQKN